MGLKEFFEDKKRVVKLMWVVTMAPVALIFLMLTLAALGVFGRIPSFEELENPKSNLATEIYGDNGHVIGTFFIENRSYVQYEDLFPADSTRHLTLDGHVVPPVVAALISTEDARFRNHSGIDIPSLFRVGIRTIVLRDQSQGGGSTITQQLAKNLFPRDTVRNRSKVGRTMKLVQSKFKEWITALKLEHNYTKEEIAAMYLNTVGYGSNAYGIKSAASTFFGKSPEELNIQEAAVLVGVVNAPTRYSPILNYDNAVNRRNTVLNRMRSAGAISRHLCDSLTALPITLNYKPITHNSGEATYFREMLRQVMNAKRPTRRQYLTDWDYEQAVKEYDENPLYGWCLKNTKADGTPYNIYRDGLRIYTTINPAMQRYAEEAIQKQMETVIQPRMDRQVKATGVLFQDVTPEERENIIKRAMKNSDRYREMRKEGKDENGHLEHTIHLIGDMHNLHLQLMHNPIGEHYRSTFAKLLPQLPQLRTMIKKEDVSDTEICFRALYAAMLYRIKGDTKRAEAIKDTIELISPVVAELSDMYRKVEQGEVDLFKDI